MNNPHDVCRGGPVWVINEKGESFKLYVDQLAVMPHVTPIYNAFYSEEKDSHALIQLEGKSVPWTPLPGMTRERTVREIFIDGKWVKL